ncbi:MAG TPA: T9SS type A sorting domain-containing protein [Hanamia sp.]|nr:T9SS type A sorting domain-containing protein [Hanamia sp.]
MKLLLRSLLFTLFAITLTSVNVFSQSATISTDQPDYAPGSTVIITGNGFQPGETVTLQVLHDPTGGDDAISPAHQPWTVVADANGNVNSSWLIPVDEDELGATLKLTAVGMSSQLTAEAMFTDASNKIGTVSIVAQSDSLCLGTAGSVTYLVTVNRDGSGAFTANLCVNTTLPSGVIASFSPSSLNFGSGDSSKQTTLTLTTAATTPSGSTNFTVRAYISSGSSTCTSLPGDHGETSSSLSVPNAVSVSLTSKTDVLCFGASTGAINITASGGTGAYTYAWTGTGVNATAEDQTGLAAGNYSVIVTDANGCSTASLPVTITQPATAVSANCTLSNPHIYFGVSGFNTSTYTVTPSGGSGPYTISVTMSRNLDCNVINSSGNETWAGVGGTTIASCGTIPVSTYSGSGPYSVNVSLLSDAEITATITDANGCTTTCTQHQIAEDARCFAGKSGIAKVMMCHVTGSVKNPNVQICVDESAVQAHLDAGDHLGNCTVVSRNMNIESAPEVNAAPAPQQTGTGKLSVKVLPNPTSYYFTLGLQSLSKENVKLVVTDITGRVIEQRTDVPANSTIQLGSSYHPGIYIAQFLQGTDRVTIRLIKEGK